jgi:hypothetical protein
VLLFDLKKEYFAQNSDSFLGMLAFCNKFYVKLFNFYAALQACYILLNVLAKNLIASLKPELSRGLNSTQLF